MWLSLTDEHGEEVLVNTAHVAAMRPGATGTFLSLACLEDDPRPAPRDEDRLLQMKLFVSESLSAIKQVLAETEVVRDIP